MATEPLPDGAKCTYCHGIAHDRDHVIPNRLLREKGRKYKGDWLVPSCHECNHALSDRMLHSVPARAAWLYKWYMKKYQKLRLTAQWSDEELEEVSGTFRQLILETQLAQAELDCRLARLRIVATHDWDYLRPKA